MVFRMPPFPRTLAPALHLAALLLAGCQPSPAVDLCADIDCSGNGTCLLLGDERGAVTPTCRCDPGYLPSPSGWLCLAASDPASPCAGFGCSSGASCVVSGGKASCVCPDGYTLGSDGKTCLDPCQGQTCSGIGTCQRTTAGALCACPLGYRVTADGKGCSSTLPSGQLTYKLIYDAYPSYTAGQATLDLSQAASGKLSEKMRFGLGLDYYGRGIYRYVWQRFTLDQSGKTVSALSYDDLYTQGKLSRRRWGKVTAGSGRVTLEQQRLDKRYSFSLTHKDPLGPLPMLGGDEFPGWTLGCFSPAAYTLLLRRYDTSKKGTQQITALWPTTGAVRAVTVKAGASYTDDAPVLTLPEQEIEVTYDKSGAVQKIAVQSQKMSWVRHAGTPADLNLSPLGSATTLSAAALPTDHSETSLTVTSTDGTTLAATLTLPSSASGKVPAVLLVSDLTGYDRDHPHAGLPRSPLYAHLAAHLAHAGVASLRYDPRGKGQSGGKAESARLTELVADAGAALAALAARAEVDGSRLSLISHGSGSLTAAALLSGGSGGPTVSRYLALAPLLTKVEDALIFGLSDHMAASGFSTNFIKKQTDYYKQTISELKAGTYKETRWHGLPAKIWPDLLAADRLAALTGFSGPVLLLRGDQDMVAPADQLTAATTAATAAGKTNLTATTLTGLTHVFAAGKRSTLWEEAFYPYELPAALRSAVLSGLGLP